MSLNVNQFTDCTTSIAKQSAAYVEDPSLTTVQRLIAICDHVLALPDPVDPDELAALNQSKNDATVLKAHCEALP